MTDETQAETPTKRGPGRPRKAPSHVKRQPMRGGDDDHQDPLENFEYRAWEHQDALAIDPDTVRNIEREWGFSLLWVMFECNGKPFPDRVNWRKRNGYAEVRAENFGRALAHMADKDGRITKEGLVLMARPVQIQRMAEAHEKRAAKAAIENMRRSHSELGPEGVTMPDGNNAVARAKNMHRQSFEPFEGGKIPD
jgi:hypothetical protein